MAKYKEITLSLGRWQYPKDDVTEIKFKGRRIAARHEFGDPTPAIRSRGIDWDMYETEEGRQADCPLKPVESEGLEC